MKILVADDDPVSLRLIQRILQRSGYEVITAQNGANALEELSRKDGPRLALLDWMMPQLDGLEVCRHIRSRAGQPYVYITMLTSKLLGSDVIAGLEAGLDDYVTKPCNPEELTARLRTGQRILQLEDSLIAARDEMRFKATHDPLTGLWNHGAILGFLGAELNRTAREQLPLSVLLCDLDHFKRINDTYGHLAGDDVLRQIAIRLRDSVRPFDVVGRYGGEEFLILLSGCSCEHLRERAEEVRDAVGREPLLADGSCVSMSISVGAVTVDDWSASASFEPLLKDVDAALYCAKSSGRNRVVIAGLANSAEGDRLPSVSLALDGR